MLLESDNKIKSKLKTTTISTVYNITLQISLRLFSFVVNAFILRFITKETLGVINVRLLLLYTTIQFITREPFRRTCAPNSSDNQEDLTTNKSQNQSTWISIMNVTFLTVPLSVIVGLVFSIIWYNCFERPEDILQQYQWAIMSIFVSVIIESFAETCFIFGQRYDYIRLKVFVEGIFQTTRCGLLAIFVYISPENSVLGFSIAQLIASITYTFVYYSYFIGIVRIPFQTFLPTYFRNEDDKSLNSMDSFLLKTWFVFLKNSTVKQFLTEGERYIMTMFSVINFAEQGVYDVINNLGSLPARLIFQQIEENAYLLFSSLIRRDIHASQQEDKIIKSLSICCNLVKLMSLIGLLLFVYGFNASAFVLYLYGGQHFLSGTYGSLAVNLFQWHCIYIMFIALNGILEAYSFAAMNTEHLNRFNHKMLLTSIIFTISSLLMTSHVGSIGFIMANCLNMLTRIIISLHFIGNILAGYSIYDFFRQSKPSVPTLISYALTFILLTAMKTLILDSNDPLKYAITWSQLTLFIILNGILVIIHLICIYFFETELIHFVENEILSRKQKIN